ncbi:ABC transporter substrate-binding protein [Burkholderia sp. 3C]
MAALSLFSMGAARAADAPKAGSSAPTANQVSNLAALVPARYRAMDALVVAVNPEVAPIKFVDENGDVTGFTPELFSAAAKLLNLKVNLVRASFDSLIPGLAANRFNALLSLGDFPSRQGKVTFVDYLKVGQSIVTSPGSRLSIGSVKDLCGVSVAIPRASQQMEKGAEVSEQCAAAGKKPLGISTYPDTNMTLLSLTNGASQVAWVDSPSANYNASRFPDKYKQVYSYYNGAYGIGFGVDPDSRKLAEAFRQALLSVEKSGGYAALMKKWGLNPADGLGQFPINNPAY